MPIVAGQSLKASVFTFLSSVIVHVPSSKSRLGASAGRVLVRACRDDRVLGPDLCAINVHANIRKVGIARAAAIGAVIQ